MHSRHKNMDDGKSAQAERRQNRSSSLSLFVFLESFHHFPPSFDYSRFHNMYFYDSARNLGFILDSKLSMKKHVLKICQTAYFELKRISSIRKFLTEDATKTLVTSTSSHGLTTATVFSWVRLILSYNLSRKYRTLLQDLFSWHPVTTSQHLS